MTNYANWHLETDSNHVLWLWLDKKDASTNSINPSVLDELADIMNQQIPEIKPVGVVFASSKKSGFIAGADISNFRNMEEPEKVREFIEKGHAVFKQIADLAIPSLALIQGFCLGGGLELALACRYRVAEISPKTKLGLPETLLGIHPGWGGCFRLPALIGAPEALQMILSGRTVDARKAKKLGLIDKAVPERNLKAAVNHLILKKPAPHQPSALIKLANHAWIRPLLHKYMRAQLMKKIKPQHYPAPFAVLDNWLKHGIELPDAMRAEIDSIVSLASQDTAHNLIRIFYLKEQMKGLAKGSSFRAQHVHVIGAGTMGGDIAAWCAMRGLHVTLQDREPKYIAPAIKRAFKLFQSKLKEKRLVDAAMDRLQPDVEGYGLATADVIIEAIYENLEAKQNLLKHIEEKAKSTAIIASNTSSIPLDEMSIVMKQPERLVGIHYFNPVAKMELVEVVHGLKTSETVVNNALAFVKQIDRLPLPVTSTPGFLVNRVLTPYLLEAVELLAEGVPPHIIDKAAVDFGMPMGPIELADTVGLDICLSVGENLSKYFGGSIPERLKQMVADGHLGRKTGKGFYEYKNGKPQKSMAKDHPEISDTIDRLILRMLNEAIACLREKVVADKDLLDAGMIFGTGFAPFRGGPMEYLATEGADKLKARLNNLQQLYGERFKPDAGWETKISDPLKKEVNKRVSA
jgi:3-hydroxyacyl-CoA dehydrogenase / enoyl-CoA hydratase / 3-hydroxybutyryl-CoA epimerase